MVKLAMDAFIFDIDGTIACNDHRSHWVKSNPKNWDAYNKPMANDVPIIPPLVVLDCLKHSGYAILICTGREEGYYDITKRWLAEHQIDYTELFMRPEGDYSDDREVKRNMLRKIEKLGYNVLGVFDDRTKVVDMWREEGLYVFDCNRTREVF